MKLQVSGANLGPLVLPNAWITTLWVCTDPILDVEHSKAWLGRYDSQQYSILKRETYSMPRKVHRVSKIVISQVVQNFATRFLIVANYYFSRVSR